MIRRTKVFKSFFLIFIAFHLGSVTFSQEWHCECDRYPERMNYCCNCPKCVDKRGGMLSYCHIQDHSSVAGEEGKNPLLETAKCACGSGWAIFTLPNDVPFIVPSPADLTSVSLSGTVKIVMYLMDLDDVVLSLDRPG